MGEFIDLAGRSGIYRILNIISGRSYIGQAGNLYFRFHSHRRALAKYWHPNKCIDYALKKHGQLAFVFGVLEFCQLDELDVKEQCWMNYFGINNLYNLEPNAGSSRGFKRGPLSEEHKRKLSAANLGRKMAPRSDQWRQRMRAAKLGKQSMIATEAARAVTKGRPLSLAHRAKIGASHLGKKRAPFSEEWRHKMGVSRRGKKFGPLPLETRLKLSAAQIAFHERAHD